MAHTICGIDVGAFSVKFAFLEVGFRTHTLRGLLETAVPTGEAPLLRAAGGRRARGAGAGVGGGRRRTSRVPGDQLSVRVLELPFSDSRKIDQVVGYELEGQIVHADRGRRVRSPGGRPAAEGATVLAAAARRDDLARPRSPPPRSAASTRARCTRRRSSIARCCRSRPSAAANGTIALPGGARLRPPAHQHLLRARRAIRSTRARSGAAAST